MMKQIKALILAGGKGSRLKPLTYAIPKPLLPVANKPVIYYVIEQITEAGIKDVGIVISPETGQQVKDTVGTGSRWGINISYIAQDKPLGIAHAVKSAQGFLNNQPFLLFLGDNLLKGGVTEFVQQFINKDVDAMILLKEVPDPSLFGVAELDKTGRVIKVEEKPSFPKSNLIVIGVYLFKPIIHLAIENLAPSKRGEFEITDAIQVLIDRGSKVQSHILSGWWLDTGNKDDMLEANSLVLEGFLEHKLEGEISSDSSISGTVEIGKGARIIKSFIKGPVSIAEDCVIINSRIGPSVSIDKRTMVESSSIEHSVIMENCRIKNVRWVTGSLIGKGVELSRAIKRHRQITLLLCDDSRIEL